MPKRLPDGLTLAREPDSRDVLVPVVVDVPGQEEYLFSGYLRMDERFLQEGRTVHFPIFPKVQVELHPDPTAKLDLVAREVHVTLEPFAYPNGYSAVVVIATPEVLERLSMVRDFEEYDEEYEDE